MASLSPSGEAAIPSTASEGPGSHRAQEAMRWAPSPERQREIADFFAAHERGVRHSVAYRLRHLPAAAIEDACQTAWEKLSRRPDVDLTKTGLARRR